MKCLMTIHKMFFGKYFFVVICVLVSVISEIMAISSDGEFTEFLKFERENRQTFRSIRDSLLNTLGGRNDRLLGTKLQERIPASEPFPCPIPVQGRIRTKPNSVHELTLADIDVVAALGDSLSVGSASGAHSLIQGLQEYRSLSWSGGAETSTLGTKDSWRRFLTLPNIIKLYNANVTGGATSTSHYWHPSSGLNLAEHAAYSRELPRMAENLVTRIEKMKNIDMQKDWKMVTIMIGSNNLGSEICFSKNPDGYLKIHREEILKTLRYLRDHLPRTFVNLVPSPDIRVWTDIRHNNPVCNFSLRLSFTCMVAEHLKPKRNKYIQIQDKMFETLEDCAKMDEFRNLTEFAVVLQPFSKNLPHTTLGQNGLTDLSPLAVDCLHFSQLGNAKFALSLFKNLMQPPKHKQKVWESWRRGHMLESFGSCGHTEWGDRLKTYDNS